MTARSVAAIASLTLALAVSPACVSFYDIGIETPIQAKLDTTPFQRVLVLGFLSGGMKDVDVNSETVRLLRSQLRTKSNLKVIDSDVVGEVRSNPAYSSRMSSMVATETPEVPTLP